MSNLDSAHFAADSTDHSSALFVHAALVGLWRHKLLMTGIIVASLVLGIIAAVAIPKQYTAEAHIRGEFLASNPAVQDEKSTISIGPISLDLERIIETQSRLLQSQQVALRVVRQIGLERLQPVVDKHRWFLPNFTGSSAKTQEDIEDIAAAKLLAGLSVITDPRAYLLTVRYSADNPELAVLITDAFVAELLRNARLQELSRQRAFAEASLSEQLAKFGDKHPRLVNVRMRLAMADDLMREQLKESPEAIRKTAGENVTNAIADAPRPRPLFVIGLLLLIGFVISIATALWLERERLWQTLSLT